ncbi:K02A2.6-like [Cordylochernes scorpioides]|uniref:K02A2.6-like n=1 Tax=Cordylochernes scorpioides TaxID=51811 RepID=A0ABY6KMY1_9ARAC|nr:K02A2.6-like [Cordylochernes scorpioides]
MGNALRMKDHDGGIDKIVPFIPCLCCGRFVVPTRTVCCPPGLQDGAGGEERPQDGKGRDCRPEAFDPKNPEKWITYLERMNFFFLANDIVKPERRKAIFLTLIGAETYALARSLASPKELSFVEYDNLIKLLTDHFSPKPNIIVQRFLFNKRNQGDESVSAYIAELRRLSEDCEFVDLDDRLRDKLVCGLRNESLVKRLLSEKDLTFEKAVNLAICDESASADASMLQEKITEVNMMKKASKTEPPNFKSGKVHFKEFKKYNNKRNFCIRCKGNHMPNVCKFRNAKCFKCGKIGHVQMACLTNVGKSGNLYRANSNPTLCCLRREEISNPYYITANLDNHDVHMLIDSGSEYSLLNKETFLEYWKLTQLKRSEILLNTWSSSQVKILGKLCPNILGRQWFSAFRLKLNFLNSLETNPISPDFEELFKEEIDAYNGPLIHIDIPDNAEPKFVKARTVPFALRNLVDEKLKALEEQGIIEPIKFSKWASPIVTVLKNDETIRICHDYKTTVNLYTNPDKYPLPTILQLLDRLRGGKVFTKLDMAQAYQQLKVDDESSEILTINTPRGLYRVKRLPFGLNSAVGTFQRFMDTLLMGIDGVAVYLDDVLISGINCGDLMKKTEKVLLRFMEAGLRLKRNKCKFYVPEIEFLGMKIDNKGIHPSEEKLIAIKDARPPSNKKELMSFLGLLNYYERFLRNKATVVEPLHRLLDSNNPWKWNREHQRAFKEAKSLISSESVLAHFDDNLPILVSCDASEYGIGAILSQVDHEVERPVVFASRTLNKTERRYAVIDKEALAVIFVVRFVCRVVTIHQKFTILHIDHVGPFQGKLFLVVVDAYSKWIEAKIVSTTSTETTINSLKEIFATHGLPDVIVSDNGTSFTSELFRTFLKRNGVRHILCAPYHAASNGQVERAIQTLKNLLRKKLSRSLLSMRIAINSTTQKSPAQLLMNRNLKSLLNKFHPESVSEGRMRQENKFIRNWKPHRVVNEGQAVIARGYHGPRWLPGVVQEKTGPVSIKVETDDGDILNRHLDQVRGCGESEVTPSTSSTPQESTNIEDPQADQEMDPAGEASGPTLRRSSRLRGPSKFFEM